MSSFEGVHIILCSVYTVISVLSFVDLPVSTSSDVLSEFLGFIFVCISYGTRDDLFRIAALYEGGSGVCVFKCCEIFRWVIQHIISLTPAAPLLLFVHLMFVAVPAIKRNQRTGFVQVPSLFFFRHGMFIKTVLGTND